LYGREEALVAAEDEAQSPSIRCVLSRVVASSQRCADVVVHHSMPVKKAVKDLIRVAKGGVRGTPIAPLRAMARDLHLGAGTLTPMETGVAHHPHPYNR